MGCRKLTYNEFLPTLKVVSKNLNISLKSCTDDYRYAFNGMEFDNEVQGGKNSYTTEFRQYDPRLGRWKSLDPLMKKYPSMSPYIAFNNNPVYYIDPTGESGILTINKETGVATISSHIIFYTGDKKHRSINTVKIVQDLQNELNAIGAKVLIDGVEYDIEFNITTEKSVIYNDVFNILDYSSEDYDRATDNNDSDARNVLSLGNKTNLFDRTNNWIRIEDEVAGGETGASRHEIGGQTGYMRASDLNGSRPSTIIHEYLHGLGLQHTTVVVEGRQVKGLAKAYSDGTYPIMASSGYVDADTGKPININNRKVVNSDIQNVINFANQEDFYWRQNNTEYVFYRNEGIILGIDYSEDGSDGVVFDKNGRTWEENQGL